QSISELYIVTGIVPISQPACRRDIPPWQGSLKLIGHPLIVVNRSRRIPDRTDQGPTEIVLTVQKLTVCQPYFPVLGGNDRPASTEKVQVLGSGVRVQRYQSIRAINGIRQTVIKWKRRTGMSIIGFSLRVI